MRDVAVKLNNELLMSDNNTSNVKEFCPEIIFNKNLCFFGIFHGFSRFFGNSSKFGRFSCGSEFCFKSLGPFLLPALPIPGRAPGPNISYTTVRLWGKGPPYSRWLDHFRPIPRWPGPLIMMHVPIQHQIYSILHQIALVITRPTVFLRIVPGPCIGSVPCPVPMPPEGVITAKQR